MPTVDASSLYVIDQICERAAQEIQSALVQSAQANFGDAFPTNKFRYQHGARWSSLQIEGVRIAYMSDAACLLPSLYNRRGNWLVLLQDGLYLFDSETAAKETLLLLGTGVQAPAQCYLRYGSRALREIERIKRIADAVNDAVSTASEVLL